MNGNVAVLAAGFPWEFGNLVHEATLPEVGKGSWGRKWGWGCLLSLALDPGALHEFPRSNICGVGAGAAAE